MAVEEINAGDSGYKIEILNGGKVADDAKDAKQAMNAYNKVMADSPEAIVGSFFSSVTLPMAEQASNDRGRGHRHCAGLADGGAEYRTGRRRQHRNPAGRFRLRPRRRPKALTFVQKISAALLAAGTAVAAF